MTTRRENRAGRRRAIGGSLALLGAILLVASFITPWWGNSESSWTEDQADAYSQAGVNLHRLSFAKPTPENKRSLAEAQTRYDALRSELDLARSQPDRTALWLRILAGLAIVGGGLTSLSANWRE